jgi:hypothetical protein
MRYADEVWTGVEYQVAAQCLRAGLVDQGVQIVEAVRRRYDGTKRNPYNEIECGDHYVRAMAGWSVFEALVGFRYDALDGALSFEPPDERGVLRCPMLAGSGWGTYAQHGDGGRTCVVIDCAFGTVLIRRVRLTTSIRGDVVAASRGRPLLAHARFGDRTVTVELAEPLALQAGDSLTVTIA